MANQWFRMYHEFATDPKMQMMSETFQRRFIMLLCLRCSNDGETLHDDEIAFQLRISNDDWNETKSVFLSKNLITEDNQPVAWERRQYESDSSTKRVRRCRNRKRQQSNNAETGNETGCNVSVTPPDTDTDTDTDTENPKNIRTPEGACTPAPADGEKPETKKTSVTRADLVRLGVDRQVAADFLTLRKAKRLPLTQTALDDLCREYDKAGLNLTEGIRVCVVKGWAGFKASWDWGEPRRPPDRKPPSGALHNFDGVDYSQGVAADGSF